MSTKQLVTGGGPVTLDPPSFSGGDHSRSADDLVQSVTLGNGGPGGAGKNQ